MTNDNKEERARLVERLNDLASSWDAEGLSEHQTDVCPTSPPDGKEGEVKEAAGGLSKTRKQAIARHLAQRKIRKDDDS